MPTTTNISLHLISDIKAIDHGAFGRPLLLQFSSSYGDTHLTLFFRDETLAKELAEAINDVMERRQPSSCPHEAAAYVAERFLG